MINDIKHILNKIGGDPDKRNILLVAVHRLYENFKTLVTQSASVVITKEIKRGENLLIGSYKKALQKNPATDVEQNQGNI